MNYKQYLAPVFLLLLGACDSDEKTYMVGTLERDRVEISVESNEPIIAIHVTDGQMLKAGDLILEQDPSRLEKLLAQQTALRHQSAARLAELKRGPRAETCRARSRLAFALTVEAAADSSCARASRMVSARGPRLSSASRAAD